MHPALVQIPARDRRRGQEQSFARRNVNDKSKIAQFYVRANPPLTPLAPYIGAYTFPRSRNDFDGVSQSNRESRHNKS